jgi:hypothetical protein
MTDAELAVVGALGGALIGSLGGAVAAVVAYLQARDQRRAEDQRHLLRLGLELGAKEWENQVQYAMQHGGKLYPPQLHAYFSARFFQLASEGRLTVEAYGEIIKELKALEKVVEKASEK